MRPSETVRWTPAAFFALGEVDNCFQLLKYLLGQKKVTKFFIKNIHPVLKNLTLLELVQARDRRRSLASL